MRISLDNVSYENGVPWSNVLITQTGLGCVFHNKPRLVLIIFQHSEPLKTDSKTGGGLDANKIFLECLTS